MLDEYVDHTHAQKVGEDMKDLKNVGSVELTNVTAKWNPDIPEPTLSNVSVRINSLSLTAIVGPVGCGKVNNFLFFFFFFRFFHLYSFFLLLTF